jgi:hypothetical protein
VSSVEGSPRFGESEAGPVSRSADSSSGVSVLRRLSGEPGRSLGERVLHHGARVTLLLALVTLVTILFLPSAGLRVTRYEQGMVAPEDVIAKIPFSVPKTEDELTRDRALAMGSVPPTFKYVPEAADTMVTARRPRANRPASSACSIRRR